MLVTGLLDGWTIAMVWEDVRDWGRDVERSMSWEMGLDMTLSPAKAEGDPEAV